MRLSPVRAQANLMTTRFKQVTVVGSINVDIVLRVPRLPAPGETLSATSLDRFPGGKGANQAAAAGRLGVKTVMVGQVGSDTGGPFMCASLNAAGVLTDGSVAALDGTATGSAVVMVLPGGENSIVIAGGANTAPWAMTAEQEAAVAEAAVVLLQRELPDAVNLQFARMADEAGAAVIMDVGGAEGPLDDELLNLVSVLSPNETELARMTGADTSSRDSIVEAAQQLVEAHSCDVLVKLGAQGSLLVSGEDVFQQPAAPVEAVVDTTGAGDCFTAAFAVARLDGNDVKAALKYATAAAALCVQQAGAMSSLPLRRDVEACLETF